MVMAESLEKTLSKKSHFQDSWYWFVVKEKKYDFLPTFLWLIVLQVIIHIIL